MAQPGQLSAGSVNLNSVYGMAFSYADKTGNKGVYTGSIHQISDPQAVTAYFKAVSEGADLLDFTLYVPPGFGSLAEVKIANVKETEDPNKLFTAHFACGQEVW